MTATRTPLIVRYLLGKWHGSCGRRMDTWSKTSNPTSQVRLMAPVTFLLQFAGKVVAMVDASKLEGSNVEPETTSSLQSKHQ